MLENIRDTLSVTVCRRYDEAKTYHDGKWVMLEPTDTSEFSDYMKLLAIKKTKITISIYMGMECLSNFSLVTYKAWC